MLGKHGQDDSAIASTYKKRLKATELEFFVYRDSYKTHFEDCLPDKEKWWSTAIFRPTAREVVDKMELDELLIWRCINARRNVLISGKAGSGKSHLLSRFSTHAMASNFRFSKCAPTGVAAMNVGGETLHRRLGLGLAEESPTALLERIEKNKRKHEKTWKFLKETDVLIIDEISMVDPKFFGKIDYLMRKARNPLLPFGGTILIMVGDFQQLGAVLKNANPNEVNTVRKSEAWASLPLARIILRRSYRQSPGPWLTVLDHSAEGNLTAEDLELLDERRGVEFPPETIEVNGKPHEIYAVEMYSHTAAVDKSNKNRLNELVEAGAKRKLFQPVIRAGQREYVFEVDQNEQKEAQDLSRNQERLRQAFPIFEVELCVGAQVMMRCNMMIDNGICNGTTGIVTAIDDHEIKVIFFVNGQVQANPTAVGRHQFKSSVGRTMQVSLFQFPLSLAWALSIHKCQGLTLDRARIHAGQCFTAGQLYVALSRIRTLEGLSLLEFNANSLITDADAVRFETREFLEEEEEAEEETGFEPED